MVAMGKRKPKRLADQYTRFNHDNTVVKLVVAADVAQVHNGNNRATLNATGNKIRIGRGDIAFRVIDSPRA